MYQDRLYGFGSIKSDYKRQYPQIDINTHIVRNITKGEYKYKEIKDYGYKTNFIPTYSGADKHLPNSGKELIEFEWKKNNPLVFEPEVRLFYPQDYNYNINITLFNKNCKFHETLWKDHVKPVKNKSDK